jgi:DNA-binding transcriptional MerR regulator
MHDGMMDGALEPAREMSIGELSRRTGVKVTTVRFYEGLGLMPAPPRTAGRRRVYSAVHERRLAFIRHARDMGFDTADLRTLLDLSDRPDMSCVQADVIARRNLAAVEQKIQRLCALRDELARMVESCANGRVDTCRVIEALGDHGPGHWQGVAPKGLASG